jgi:AraC-like DNA-binding protein
MGTADDYAFDTDRSPAAALLALFDRLPDVFLFVKDRDHRFRVVNEAEWRFHGCRSAADMVGRTDEDFHPPVLARQYVAEDDRVMASGRPLERQIWLVGGADGRPRWYACTKLPVVEAGGRVVGVAGIRQPHDHAGAGPGEYARLTPAVEFVLQHYPDPVSVDHLADLVGLSVSQLQREFRRLFGTTPQGYVSQVRMQAARRQLETTADAVGAVSAACGFGDQSYFVKRFKAATGLRPREYRRRFARSASAGGA